MDFLFLSWIFGEILYAISLNKLLSYVCLQVEICLESIKVGSFFSLVMKLIFDTRLLIVRQKSISTLSDTISNQTRT